jgi:hypothetical protein
MITFADFKAHVVRRQRTYISLLVVLVCLGFGLAGCTYYKLRQCYNQTVVTTSTTNSSSSTTAPAAPAPTAPAVTPATPPTTPVAAPAAPTTPAATAPKKMTTKPAPATSASATPVDVPIPTIDQVVAASPPTVGAVDLVKSGRSPKGYRWLYTKGYDKAILTTELARIVDLPGTPIRYGLITGNGERKALTVGPDSDLEMTGWGSKIKSTPRAGTPSVDVTSGMGWYYYRDATDGHTGITIGYIETRSPKALGQGSVDEPDAEYDPDSGEGERWFEELQESVAGRVTSTHNRWSTSSRPSSQQPPRRSDRVVQGSCSY